MEPLIFTSLSMFTIPLLPQAVATVILDGFPKVCSPVLNTDKPFITPTCFPSISINVFSFLYDSSIFSSILSILFFFANIALSICLFSIYFEPSILAYRFPSSIISINLLKFVDSLFLSSTIFIL